MNAGLVVNPVAGSRAYKYINRLNEILGTALVDTFITQKRGDAFEFAKHADRFDRLIVAGGDGTVNEVVNGLLASENAYAKDIPVAIIPAGTANVLALELDIPHDIKRASDTALHAIPRKISLGRINDKHFLLMAGIGFDGETVLGVRDNLIKRISGKTAHIISAVKVIQKYKPCLMNIKTADNEYSGYTAVIGNARCYGGNYFVTPHASLYKPSLELCLFKGKTRSDILRFVTGVIFRRHLKYKDVIYKEVTELEITSEKTVHIQTDGDYFGKLPVKIDVVRDAISVVC